MLNKISYICKSCGLNYNFLHYVDSKQLKTKLGNVLQKCSECGSSIEPIVTELKPPYFTVQGDKVLFLDNVIFRFDDNMVSFDLKGLLNAGYSGMVNIQSNVDSTQIGINTIYKAIGKASSIKKKAMNRMMPHSAVIREDEVISTREVDRPTYPVDAPLSPHISCDVEGNDLTASTLQDIIRTHRITAPDTLLWRSSTRPTINRTVHRSRGREE